jgi:CHAT domain-containing protein
MQEEEKHFYLEFVKELLSCSEGEEWNLLSVKPQMVNEQLIEALLNVAVMFAQEDKQTSESTVGWLVGFAQDLATQKNLDLTSESKKQLLILMEELQSDFLMEVLQSISKNNSDVQIVYPLFEHHLEMLNDGLVKILEKWLNINFIQFKSGHQLSIMYDIASFGNLIRQFSGGELSVNIDLSIGIYNIVSQLLDFNFDSKLWAMTKNNLAHAYLYRINGDRKENIENAIDFFNQALSISNQEKSPLEWAMTQYNLVIAYLNRISGDEEENIETAIMLCEKTLEVYKKESFPVEWAMTQYNLAKAYKNRIAGYKGENLEAAIFSCQAALEVYTKESLPSKWDSINTTLADIYTHRIKGNLKENLEDAIFLCQAALEIRTKDKFPLEWAETQNILACAHRERNDSHREESLEKAIILYEEVLEVYTKESYPLEWAMVKHNIGTAYNDRIKGYKGNNLEIAISTFHEALEIRTKDKFPSQWARTNNNLANAYRERIIGDRGENIEAAIVSYELSLKIRTREKYPLLFAMTHINLANAYRDRVKGSREENIEAAINSCQKAVEFYTKDEFPIEWSLIQSNFAVIYSERIKGGQEENIEAAIFYYNSAFEMKNKNDSPLDWAVLQNNIGTSYVRRMKGSKDENLNLAINSFDSALEVYTKENFPLQWADIQSNIATSYSKYLTGNRIQNLEIAINCCKNALTVYSVGFHQKCLQNHQMIADMQAECQNWVQAVESYQNAIIAAETIYQSCDFLYSKSAELEKAGSLFRRAAYAYAKVGDLQSAVVAIEIGRARGLSESLERDRANLQQLAQINKKLVEQYQKIVDKIRKIEAEQRQPQTPKQLQSANPDDQRNTVANLREKLKEVIDQIRQQPGYEDFLRPPTIKDIFLASQPHQPIIYLIPAPNGSLALIVKPQEIIPVWIDSFTATNLQDLTERWFNAYSGQDYSIWQQEIDHCTQTLWQVMAPIIDQLEKHDLQQAILIPTAFFSLFPLHASWKEDLTTISKRHYALDSICFSYAPNARSISECRSIAELVTPDKLLAIDEPTHQGANPLPNSSREVTSAISTFPNSLVLRHQEATRQATIDNLPLNNVWHCSCHGNVNFGTPLDSGLYLAGVDATAILTLRDLLTLQLTAQQTGGIRLTILSACETGLPGLSNIDEVISLPAGLLQAGVAGVVASLWSVGELSTMILLSRFYTLWRIEGLEPSIALCTSQQWLRDAESDEIIKHYSTFVPDLDRQKELRRALKLTRYSSPYHWAAFSYTGV